MEIAWVAQVDPFRIRRRGDDTNIPAQLFGASVADLVVNDRVLIEKIENLIVVVQKLSSFVPRGALVPLFGIMGFHGSASAIPDGFALCNGQTVNGRVTPNLVGRLQIGASNAVGTAYPVGATGGSEVASLGIANMPSHDHGGAGAAGGHTHGAGTTGTEGGHKHFSGTYTFAFGYEYAGNTTTASTSSGLRVTDIADLTGGGGTNVPFSKGVTGESGSVVGNHDHTIGNAADHTHNIPLQGSGTSFSIRNPYYVMAQMMRVY